MGKEGTHEGFGVGCLFLGLHGDVAVHHLEETVVQALSQPERVLLFGLLFSLFGGYDAGLQQVKAGIALVHTSFKRVAFYIHIDVDGFFNGDAPASSRF